MAVSEWGIELAVPATAQVRALLGDWLCRTLLPLWLFAAGLEQEAVRCRELPVVTAQLVDSPGRLRPLARVLAQVHRQAGDHLFERERGQPSHRLRLWPEVSREVLGATVVEAASTARQVFAGSRAGQFGYAALLQCVPDAALGLDAGELVGFQRRTEDQFWDLVGALTVAAAAHRVPPDPG